jgi:hypothetical protein
VDWGCGVGFWENIRNRAVVRAGSLANRDVGVGKVVAGVPARVVRRKGGMKLGGEAAGQAGMVGNGVTDCLDAWYRRRYAAMAVKGLELNYFTPSLR